MEADPEARRIYEDVNGTTEYDPDAIRWMPEETLPAETPPETLPPETTAPPEPVTGIHGGPGLTMPETEPYVPTVAETVPAIGPGVQPTAAPVVEAPAPAPAPAPAAPAEPDMATVGPAPGP